ncbi:MAG: glycosyltransferase family 2 protein [Gammaproteobacteria bacterium]|jgi:glycosyltransferase involved in cell wall biosynthesis|tara:strand:+ start:3373 stop:4338 length:966 start_codon:yes stop_codon:yes gene_type:complete
MDKNIEISVIAPVLDEKENLVSFVDSVSKIMIRYGKEWELIIVDDGSTDGSTDVLKNLSTNPRIRTLLLSKNFGQTSAIQAGFDNALGKYFVTLDSDLQNDPEDIPNLLNKLTKENLDLVVGWRKNRKDNYFLRNFPSMIANKLIGSITGVKLHDYGCSLKAYRAEVLKEVRLYGEMHRFIPAWIATKIPPSKIAEMEVKHHPRMAGTSKYGISRTFRVFVDLISVYFFMRFFSRPGHFFGLIGLMLSAIGSLILVHLVSLKLLYGLDIGDRPLLVAGTLLVVVGIQLISLGVIGEILSRTYFASSKEKSYFIRWDSNDKE